MQRHGVTRLLGGVLCTGSLRTAQRTIPALPNSTAIQDSFLQRSSSPSSDNFVSESERRGEHERVCAGAGTSSSLFVHSLLSGCPMILPRWNMSLRSFAYSSLAVVRQEDETVEQASEIGYEVVGKYVPEGLRISPQAAFAVVRVGSHQFKVTPGDQIYTEKLKYADINDQLLLNKVLLVGSLNQTIIGRPTVPDASVVAVVEEIALDAKVIIFKKKRRKNYRRTKGHRQELTRLRILSIEGLGTPSLSETDYVKSTDTV